MIIPKIGIDAPAKGNSNILVYAVIVDETENSIVVLQLSIKLLEFCNYLCVANYHYSLSRSF
jgi:hypothetical protein